MQKRKLGMSNSIEFNEDDSCRDIIFYKSEGRRDCGAIYNSWVFLAWPPSSIVDRCANYGESVQKSK